jgi:hypothetical protein
MQQASRNANAVTCPVLSVKSSPKVIIELRSVRELSINQYHGYGRPDPSPGIAA